MHLGIKGILLAALGVGIGGLAAWGVFQFQIANTKEGFFDGQWAPKAVEVAQQEATKLTVDGLNPRDLGSLLTGTKTSVDFLLRNPGGRKLKFQMSGPPPSALTVDLPTGGAEIAAGSTYPITITVSPAIVESKFNKSIVLQTEAGARTVLTITAKVDGGLGLVNNAITYSRAQLGTENIKDAVLICATTDSLQLKQILFEGKSDLPEWLSVEPLAMNSDLLSNHPGAKSGLVVRITVGAGLPPELKTARLELVTDQPQFQPQIINLKFED